MGGIKSPSSCKLYLKPDGCWKSLVCHGDFCPVADQIGQSAMEILAGLFFETRRSTHV